MLCTCHHHLTLTRILIQAPKTNSDALLEVVSGFPLSRLSSGLNDSVAVALARIPPQILDVLLGVAPPPTDPIGIFGVRSAAVSVLAPVFANDLAPFVSSKLPVAAAATLLWGDDASEDTWSRILI